MPTVIDHSKSESLRFQLNKHQFSDHLWEYLLSLSASRRKYLLVEALRDRMRQEIAEAQCQHAIAQHVSAPAPAPAMSDLTQGSQIESSTQVTVSKTDSVIPKASSVSTLAGTATLSPVDEKDDDLLDLPPDRSMSERARNMLRM
ncbi:hypothetical protein C4K68_09645 [Pokkaliibacter plantistimulans]|uniref:Uncharacterized protein n=1 Tax=Proteobacteria bacterium 228 TaxID=2083153 RepID=A0A2S5KSG2_9PROT|nr:hypothetical protein C4K68_09645 [Pokkaliibacter plantistimulans]